MIRIRDLCCTSVRSVYIFYILHLCMMYRNEYKQKVQCVVYTGHINCIAHVVYKVCSEVGVWYERLWHILCAHIWYICGVYICGMYNLLSIQSLCEAPVFTHMVWAVRGHISGVVSGRLYPDSGSPYLGYGCDAWLCLPGGNIFPHWAYISVFPTLCPVWAALLGWSLHLCTPTPT